MKKLTTFEEIIRELKYQGRHQDAINWIESFLIPKVEKKILILHLVEDLGYKEISYNDKEENCINLSISNLSRLQKTAIKSANKFMKQKILEDFGDK